ncbi:hypothetical protein VNN41_10070 [Lactococcus garvieae]|uniref:hypothetical protein n=1 Tax=Lactococcus garvieae TaxID=1363 RepID=UPI00324D5CC5
MALDQRRKEEQIKASRTAVGLVNNNPESTRRFVGRAEGIAYEKKKGFQFTLTPSIRQVLLPELTQALGLKSDSATLEYLIQEAYKEL